MASLATDSSESCTIRTAPRLLDTGTAEGVDTLAPEDRPIADAYAQQLERARWAIDGIDGYRYRLVSATLHALVPKPTLDAIRLCFPCIFSASARVF